MTKDAITGEYYMSLQEKIYVALGVAIVLAAAYLWITEVLMA
jgi:hypothetical protein